MLRRFLNFQISIYVHHEVPVTHPEITLAYNPTSCTGWYVIESVVIYTSYFGGNMSSNPSTIGLQTRCRDNGCLETSPIILSFVTMYFSFLNFQFGVCAHLGHLTQITSAHNPARCTGRYVNNNYYLCSIAKAYCCCFWRLCGIYYV